MKKHLLTTLVILCISWSDSFSQAPTILSPSPSDGATLSSPPTFKFQANHNGCYLIVITTSGGCSSSNSLWSCYCDTSLSNGATKQVAMLQGDFNNVLSTGTTYYWHIQYTTNAQDCGNAILTSSSACRSFTKTCSLPSGSFTLLSPINNDTASSANPRLSWSSTYGSSTTTYRLHISSNSAFRDTVFMNGSLPYSSTYCDVTGLSLRSQYWWRIRAEACNGTQSGSWYQSSFYTPHPHGTITIQTPSNGEVFPVGSSSFAASWNATNVSLFNVDLSTNSGTSWSPVEQSWGSSQCSVTLPQFACNCILRVSDASDPFAVATRNFAVGSATPTLQITSPTTSSIFSPGDGTTVRWSETNVSGSVFLEYSTDNGTNWASYGQCLATSLSNPFTIPNTTATSLIIGIRLSSASPGHDLSSVTVNIQQASKPPDSSLYTYKCGGNTIYQFDASQCTGKKWKGVANGTISATGTCSIGQNLLFNGTLSIDTIHSSIDAQGSWYLANIPLPGGTTLGKFDLRDDHLNVQFDCAHLIFVGLSKLADYGSTKLGGFKFRMDSLSFISGGVEIGCALLWPDVIGGACGASKNDTTNPEIALNPIDITTGGISANVQLKDFSIYSGFCLDNLTISYNQAADTFAISGYAHTPFFDEIGMIAGWQKGLFNEFGLSVNLAASIPIGTTGMGLKGVRGYCEGWSIPPIDFSLGGTLNEIADPDFMEVDLDAAYNEPSTINGTAEARILNLLGQWQVQGSLNAEYDWNKYLSFAGSLKAGTLDGQTFVIDGSGIANITWNPWNVDGSITGTLSVPALPSDNMWDDWANTVLFLPHPFANVSAVLKERKLKGNLSVDLGLTKPDFHFVVDMNPGSSDFFTFGSGTIPLSRAEGDGKVQIQAVGDSSFNVPKGVSSFLIRIRSNGIVPSSKLSKPDGASTGFDLSDTGISFTNSGTKAFWFVQSPSSGKWTLSIPAITIYDTVEISGLPEPPPLNVSVKQDSNNVIVTWDTAGSSSIATVTIYLSSNDSGYQGTRIGAVNSFVGSLDFHLDDSLPNCQYFVYGLRDDDNGIVQGYAKDALVINKSIPVANGINHTMDSMGRLVVEWTPPASSEVVRYLIQTKDMGGYDSIWPSVSASQGSDTLEISQSQITFVSMLGFGPTGLSSCWSQEVAVTPSLVNDEHSLSPLLLAVRPNPANRSAIVSYSLSTNSSVNLELFDVLGNRVKTLIDEQQIDGEHSITLNLEYLTPGTYYCRVSTSYGVGTAKLVVSGK